MTRDIRTTRDRLGLKTSELARLVGVGERTALRWVKGERAVPEPVWRLLEAHGLFERILALPPLADHELAAEISRFTYLELLMGIDGSLSIPTRRYL